jgi:putative transposase
MAARFRLYPEPSAVAVMVRHNADARYVWNLALEQANTYQPARGPTPNNAVRMRQLSEARQGTWLGVGSSVVQQGALRDFDQALKNWWGGTHRRPTWRKAGQSERFRVRDLSVAKLTGKWGTVHVPKAGPVRFRLTRPWSDVRSATSARVTLDRAGRWHVSFTTPRTPFERTSTEAVIALDLGIAASVATSTGELLKMPPLLSAGENQRKRRLQQKMARQDQGSNRRARTKSAVARLAAREVDRRKDWIEKTTTQLVKDHDLIAVEALTVKNMVRSARGSAENPGRKVAQKRGLNRSIQSQAWALFRKRLTEKATAATSPCEVVAVNPANTSRRCSECGHTAKENRESQAIFRCQSCGYTDNADVNAAKTILAAGLAVSGRGADCKPPGPPGPVANGVEASTPRTVAA